MRGRRNPEQEGLASLVLRKTPQSRVNPTPKRFLRKEVIQPQVPLRLPCYDFTPVADLTVAGCLLKG